jgi:hypothetical protein
MAIREAATQALAVADAEDAASNQAAIANLGDQARNLVKGFLDTEPRSVEVRFEEGIARLRVEDLVFYFLAKHSVLVLEAPEDDELERTGLLADPSRPDIPLAIRGLSDVGYALERGVSGPGVDGDPLAARAARIAKSVRIMAVDEGVGFAIVNSFAFQIVPTGAQSGEAPATVAIVWNPNA